MRFDSPEELLQGHAIVIAKIAEGSEGDAMLGGFDTADVQFQVKANVFLRQITLLAKLFQSLRNSFNQDFIPPLLFHNTNNYNRVVYFYSTLVGANKIAYICWSLCKALWKEKRYLWKGIETRLDLSRNIP